MTDKQENANETSSPEPEDRLEKIKQEAQEDASSYYDQGKSDDDTMTEADFNKPVPKVDEDKEEMNLMKALAYLGFGMGALAIIVILFFLRDLDHKVGNVDAAVGSLEQQFGPLKRELDDSLAKVNADVSQLKERFGNYERQAAVTELKRALVAIQTVTENTAPEVQAKSNQVITSIENLLQELGAGSPGSAPATAATAPASQVSPAVPAAPTGEEKPFEIILEQPSAETTPMAEAVSPAEMEAEPAASAEAAIEAAVEEAPAEEPAAEEDSGGGDESDNEEDEEDE